MADDVTINIRTRGARQSSNEMRGVATAIGAISPAAARAATGLRAVGTASAGAAGRGLRLLRNQASYAGLAVGGIGAIAIRSGLQFNASMEQNQIAFRQFLGSSEAARGELTTLYGLAKATPFEFPQLTQAARKFLAFGFNVKQANSLLGTVGDAAAGAGLGADAIDRMVLSLGQIRSKGRLQAEELLQLQELGVLDTGDLRKHLGLTADQMANIGNEGVSANKAIRAIQATLNDTFAGQSAQQAKTFSGQISTLHDNLNQMMGGLTRPGFNVLRRDVLPALNDTATRVNDIFGRKNLSLEDKITLSRSEIRHRLGPLAAAAREEIGGLDLGDKLGDAFEAAAPRMADAAGRAAPRVAGAFVNSWLHAGPWGKLFVLGLLGKKLGVFSALGRIAAGRFLATYGPSVAAGEAAAGAGGAGGAAGLIGRAGLYGAAGAAALGAGYFGTRALLHATGGDKALQRLLGNDPTSIRQRSQHKLRDQGRVQVDIGGSTAWMSPQDARSWRAQHGGRARARAARGATGTTPLQIHTHVELNRRELGKAVDDWQLDEQARGRRRSR